MKFVITIACDRGVCSVYGTYDTRQQAEAYAKTLREVYVGHFVEVLELLVRF